MAHADRAFGRLVRTLRQLGVYDGATIVVLSDHGEEFGDHGWLGHGRSLFEEMVRVPLLVKLPGGRHGGTRVATRVSTVDVLPTLLHLAGLPAAPPLDGRVLPPVVPARTSVRPVFSEVLFEAGPQAAGIDLRAFVAGRLKCIESRGPVDRRGEPVAPWRTFDLDLDPAEAEPYVGEHARNRRCRERFATWWQRRGVEPVAAVPVDEETREELRALGYVQ